MAIDWRNHQSEVIWQLKSSGQLVDLHLLKVIRDGVVEWITDIRVIHLSHGLVVEIGCTKADTTPIAVVHDRAFKEISGSIRPTTHSQLFGITLSLYIAIAQLSGDLLSLTQVKAVFQLSHDLSLHILLVSTTSRPAPIVTIEAHS